MRRVSWNILPCKIHPAVKKIREFKIRVGVPEGKFHYLQKPVPPPGFHADTLRFPGIQEKVSSGSSRYFERNQFILGLDEKNSQLIPESSVFPALEPDFIIERLLRL